jgi:hypothetical protein
MDQNVTEPWSDMNFFFHIKGGKLNDQIIAKGCQGEHFIK